MKPSKRNIANQEKKDRMREAYSGGMPTARLSKYAAKRGTAQANVPTNKEPRA